MQMQNQVPAPEKVAKVIIQLLKTSSTTAASQFTLALLQLSLWDRGVTALLKHFSASDGFSLGHDHW